MTSYTDYADLNRLIRTVVQQNSIVGTAKGHAHLNILQDFNNDAIKKENQNNNNFSDCFLKNPICPVIKKYFILNVHSTVVEKSKLTLQ